MRSDDSEPASSMPLRRDLLVGGAWMALAGLMPPLAFARPAEAAVTPKRGGTLRVAVPPGAALDPVRMTLAGTIAVVQQVAEYLVWVEPDLSLRPALATAWHTSDGGKTWIFDIRQNVRFHDGRELTAEDVVASFQRLIDPKSASGGAAQFSFLKGSGITKLEKYKVRFELARPIGQFPYYTNSYNAVILPADYKGDFEKKPIGTGPFKLKDFRPQQGASLVRNPDYWDKGKPYLDAVEIGNFAGIQPMMLALQGGQVDLLLNGAFIDLQPLLRDENINLLAVPAAEHRQLTMRTDMKPFDDKRVRQAVALCLQRGALVKGLLGTHADLGNDHPVAPLFPEKIELDQREADLAQARQLLAEAGHPQGFTTDLYTEQYLEIPQYAQFIKQMLAPAGIVVNLHIEPVDTYYGHWTEVGFGLTDWTSRPTAIQTLATAFKGGGEWNASRFRNDEFDALLDRIEAAADGAARAKHLQRAAEILHDEVPAVIAYFNNNIRPMRKNVRGVPGSISQFLDLTTAWLA